MVARSVSSPVRRNITAISLRNWSVSPTGSANSYRDCCNGLPFSCDFFRSAFPKTNLPHVHMGETIAATFSDARTIKPDAALLWCGR